jgi:hypothetical protein
LPDHARFNHHRRRDRDRSRGRAPVGGPGRVPDVAWTRGRRGRGRAIESSGRGL